MKHNSEIMRLCSLNYIKSVIHSRDRMGECKARLSKLNNDVNGLSYEEIKPKTNINTKEDKFVSSIIDKNAFRIYLEIYQSEIAEYLAKMDGLSYKEQIVLSEIYFSNKKIKQVAKSLKISKRRVYQLRDSALDKLYNKLDEEYKRLPR